MKTRPAEQMDYDLRNIKQLKQFCKINVITNLNYSNIEVRFAAEGVLHQLHCYE